MVKRIKRGERKERGREKKRKYMNRRKVLSIPFVEASFKRRSYV